MAFGCKGLMKFIMMPQRSTNISIPFLISKIYNLHSQKTIYGHNGENPIN